MPLFNCHTVELRSKGPGRKGIPPIREIISGPIGYFPIYFYIGYKGISVHRKNKAGPLKSLGAKFHCKFNLMNSIWLKVIANEFENGYNNRLTK